MKEQLPFHVLVSYVYLRSEKTAARVFDLLDRPDIRILLDSGAFTNYTHGGELVNIDGYMDLLSKYRSRLWNYIIT